MKILVFMMAFFIVSCQSPRGGSVAVGNSYPRKNCKPVGQVIGSANSMEDSYNKALADLRYEAAARDGNYVRILATSAHGATIRGMAYRCR